MSSNAFQNEGFNPYIVITPAFRIRLNRARWNRLCQNLPKKNIGAEGQGHTLAAHNVFWLSCANNDNGDDPCCSKVCVEHN
jgi:hypothetical protein